MKCNYQIKCAIDNGPYEIIESISKFIKKVGDTDSHTFTMEEKDLRDGSVVYYKITGHEDNTLIVERIN